MRRVSPRKDLADRNKNLEYDVMKRIRVVYKQPSFLIRLYISRNSSLLDHTGINFALGIIV